jgi:hypothetical protein
MVVENMRTSATEKIPIILNKCEVKTDASEHAKLLMHQSMQNLIYPENDILFINKLHTHYM